MQKQESQLPGDIGVGIWCTDDPLWWFNSTNQGPCRLNIKVTPDVIHGYTEEPISKRKNAVFHEFRLKNSALLKIDEISKPVPLYLFQPFIPFDAPPGFPQKRGDEVVTIINCTAFLPKSSTSIDSQ